MNPALVLHGGAGAFRVASNRRMQVYREGLARACEAGWRSLLDSSALDAVEVSVRWMEDSGHFNAGLGSHLTISRKVEMDAAIMDGATLRVGAVGAVRRVKNPVVLARRIMEETDHVLLVGEGALHFSRLLGLEETDEHVTEEKLERHRSVMDKWSEGESYTWLRHLSTLVERFPGITGTVGAVAIDESGNLAAAVSTGGYWLKLEGRVADSAVAGAGLYADNSSGATCATGVGEAIMKMVLSREVCDGIRRGWDAQKSCTKAIETISTRLGGQNAGIIAVDPEGRIGAAFNTAGMGRARMSLEQSEPIVAVLPEESF